MQNENFDEQEYNDYLDYLEQTMGEQELPEDYKF
jgi:hypothetical protein